MSILKSILLLIFCLSIQQVILGQELIEIIDDTDRKLGRFKTQLYMNEDGRLKKLRGNLPKVNAPGSEVELVLKATGLRWFEDENIDEDLVIKRSGIRLSDKKSLKLSSERSNYTLAAGSDEDIEIKFKVYSNGDYNLSFPYKAGSIEGTFIQSVSVSGLSAGEKAGKPIGAIADIKKAWKETDKRSKSEVQAFIDAFGNNELAKEEGLDIIANRTLKRIEARASKDLSELSEDDLEITPDEEAWEEIGDSNDEEALQKFLSDFPDSKYAEAAKAKLGMEANVLLKSGVQERVVANSLTKKDHNIYTLDLSHLDEVEVKVSDPDDIEIYDTGGNIYELKVKGSKKYVIDVLDKSSSDKFAFDLDNELRAKLNQTGKDFSFAVQGGVSPYSVEFYKENENESKLEARFDNLTPDKLNEVTVRGDQLSSSGMDGQYDKVILKDATTDAKITYPINLQVTPKKTSSRILLGVLLAAILIGGGAMVFFNKRRKKTRDEYLAKAKAMQKTQKVNVPPVATSIASDIPPSSKPARKITISKTERKFVPPNGGGDFVSSGKMKITRREAKGGRLTNEEFEEALKGDKYAFMDLGELWPDTAIKDLYLSKECIKALGKFLKEENLDKAIAEMDGAIPEVGGFLMGYHQLDEATGDIRVTMDEFVPFVPEYHDVFKIEIGTATLVQELGDAQDTHPDKDVIGWFHTHPGHGLFLSNSDLSVQRHFPQNFQIAMEIDSLTPTLDTAFFTRKHDGSINNVEHRKKGAKWFSWKKIEKV